MTGSEHFAEAERDLDRANECDISDGEAGFMLARAQVHATLALADAAGRVSANVSDFVTMSLDGPEPPHIRTVTS